VAAYLAIFYHKQAPVIPSTNPVPSISNPGKNSSSASSSPAGSSSQSPAPSTKSSNPTASSSSALVAPYGDFVNTHSVNGSVPMYSVCNTSPGANCYIEFTKNGTTTKLSSQTTDSNGTTYWYWNSSSLNAGSWTVTAVATSNGQTKATTDARPLVVQ
jgi:hypothetical protein